MRDVNPDLALGTTPLVQAAKEQGIPAVYFTNMVSARPLFGAAGCGALPAIVAAQTAGRERFSRMVAFFDTPKPKTPVIVPSKKTMVAPTQVVEGAV
jgi:chlorophyllide a reductase subunit Y